jgi:hypothetical protein
LLFEILIKSFYNKLRIYKDTSHGEYLEGISVMIEIIGILMRLPFFLIGIILWSIVAIPFWILVFFIEGVELSLSFFGYAWRNEREEWKVKSNAFKEDYGIRFFVDPYRELFRWLLGA